MKLSLSLSIWLTIVLYPLTSFAQTIKDELIVHGQPMVEAESIKCGDDKIEGISTKRLANCDSAVMVDLSYHGGDFQAVRFMISPDDAKISQGTRAELRDLHESHNGDVSWYRFSTLLPLDFPVDAKHRLVLAQWHERIHEGGESLRPPLSHRLWDNRFVVTLWNADRVGGRGLKGDGEILFELPELELGRFYEFVYRIHWSGDDDGSITGWLRTCPPLNPDCPGSLWSRIIDYHGQTGYPNSQIESYYFKLGLYTVSEFETPFTAYHRDYHRGDSAADIGLTDPVFQALP